jgi:Uma2 family endonuclease
MNAAVPTYTSYEDYLALEEARRDDDVKHEWCDGAVYSMSRGTPEHGRLTANIGFLLVGLLRGKCTSFASETMIFVERAKLSTYADFSFVCGEVEQKTVINKNGVSLGVAITNPTVIVEVLSDSTERYDRDGKFNAYKLLPSLEEYVLVSQHEPSVEVYRRDSNGSWTIVETAKAGGSVTVHGARVAVADVYAA